MKDHIYVIHTDKTLSRRLSVYVSDISIKKVIYATNAIHVIHKIAVKHREALYLLIRKI